MFKINKEQVHWSLKLICLFNNDSQRVDVIHTRSLCGDIFGLSCRIDDWFQELSFNAMICFQRFGSDFVSMFSMLSLKIKIFHKFLKRIPNGRKSKRSNYQYAKIQIWNRNHGYKKSYLNFLATILTNISQNRKKHFQIPKFQSNLKKCFTKQILLLY